MDSGWITNLSEKGKNAELVEEKEYLYEVY